MSFYGIDGCRAGWVVAQAESTAAAGSPRFALRADLHDILAEEAAGGATVAIDIPIGLRDGPRACDWAARLLLGRPRASSVFPAPARTLVAAWGGLCAIEPHAERYARACQLSYSACGRRVSKQLFNIIDKIAQVDRLMAPALQARVREAHPEVSFCVLNGGRPMAHGKKTCAGRDERLTVLARQGLAFDPDRVRAALGGPSRVAVDDIIDAAACMVTARRVARGEARQLPPQPEHDARGLRMEICA